MIYCCFDSDSEKVSVPVADPDINLVYQQNKICTNLAFSMLEAALFPRKLASHFWFVDFLFHLYWIRIQIRLRKWNHKRILVPLRQKFTVPAFPVPVTYHYWFLVKTQGIEVYLAVHFTNGHYLQIRISLIFEYNKYIHQYRYQRTCSTYIFTIKPKRNVLTSLGWL